MFKSAISRLVAICAIVTGASISHADESAPGYDPNPTYVKFEMRAGDVRFGSVMKKNPLVDDESAHRDDYPYHFQSIWNH
jgi:hypothetical protein